MRWAEEHCDEPAVVGAVIDVGNCLNLTDSHYIGLVEDQFRLLEEDLEAVGSALPTDACGSDTLERGLDCFVVQHLLERTDEEYRAGSPTVGPFDSARGLLSEGRPIYENARLANKTCMQICVRNPNCIKGYFVPVEQDRAWRLP